MSSTGWIRYHQPDLDVKAGVACAFAVHEKVIKDREFYRTTSTWSNGNPRSQQWRGPLVMRYTNKRTGRSIAYDLSGHARIDYYRDGDFRYILVESGHFGATVGRGNVPTSLYRVGGHGSSMTATHGGYDTLRLSPAGTAQNICFALSVGHTH